MKTIKRILAVVSLVALAVMVGYVVYSCNRLSVYMGQETAAAIMGVPHV